MARLCRWVLGRGCGGLRQRALKCTGIEDVFGCMNPTVEAFDGVSGPDSDGRLAQDGPAVYLRTHDMDGASSQRYPGIKRLLDRMKATE